MDKSPLAMLAKACETIGYNSDSSSPNKGKSHSKNGSNGSSKPSNNGHRHSLQNSPHGNHANSYLDMNGKVHDNGLNGNSKHIKKESGQQHLRKGSPRANGALTCEPSTSSPSNGQQHGQHSFNMANNGAFPGLLQRCFSGSMPPNAMQMPNQPLGMMSGMPLPGFPGYPAGANPFNIMAAMAALGQQGMPPPPGMMPATTTSRIPSSGANPNSITTTTTALSAPIPATSQPLLNPLSKTPPATTVNHAVNKRSSSSALATPTSAPAGQINQLASQAEMEFATAMAQQQQAMAMFGNPFGPFPPNAMFAPQNGVMHPAAMNAMMQAMVGQQTGQTPQGYLDSSTAAQGSSASVQAMLMAAACGQQPRFVCTYAIKNSSCNKSFETEAELFGHYRQHISQLTSSTNASSPILVSSTTTDPTVSTASSAPPSTPNINTFQQQQNGGGKMKPKHSSPPAASPKQPASLPPMWNGSSAPQMALTPNANNNRFHPYSMKMPHAQPPTSTAQQQLQQQQQQQAMAAAMNAQQQQHQIMAMQQAMAAQYEMAMAAAAGMPPPFAMMNPAQQMAFANGLMMQPGAQQQQQAVEKTV